VTIRQYYRNGFRQFAETVFAESSDIRWTITNGAANDWMEVQFRWCWAGRSVHRQDVDTSCSKLLYDTFGSICGRFRAWSFRLFLETWKFNVLNANKVIWRPAAR
jgi:hypothetical protein